MLPPKAVRCETEYRRSFKKSRFSCSATTYQHNLDFRTEQKRRFVEHNPEPFAWDPEDIESDSGSDQSCEDLGRSNRLTHTQYKHEKLNRLYKKRMSGKQEENINEGKFRKDSTRDVSQQESDDEREETDEEHDGGSESESEASVVHIIEPEFVEEPARRTASARPVANKQTQTDREMNLHVEKRSLPAPFVPYGYEADVKEMGKKLTHNVRAAREIYPSALRAQKNRRTASQQHRTQGKNGQALVGKSAQLADHLRLTTSEPVGIFVHTDEFDDPDWVTEYDRNFQLYDAKAYRSRPDSARVRARELVPQLSSKARKQTRR